MSRPWLWSAAALGLAVFALPGCGPKGEYAAVHGQVTCNGRMVTEGQVVFFEPEQNVYQAARIRPDGTYSAKMSDGPGLLLGTYQVAVMPPVIEGPNSKSPGPRAPGKHQEIPIRYRNPKSSGLKLEVLRGDNAFPIDMKP